MRRTLSAPAAAIMVTLLLTAGLFSTVGASRVLGAQERSAEVADNSQPSNVGPLSPADIPVTVQPSYPNNYVSEGQYISVQALMGQSTELARANGSMIAYVGTSSTSPPPSGLAWGTSKGFEGLTRRDGQIGKKERVKIEKSKFGSDTVTYQVPKRQGDYKYFIITVVDRNSDHPRLPFRMEERWVHEIVP